MSPRTILQRRLVAGLPWPARVRLRRRASRSSPGQALVEFAFVLLPILLLIVGIVQFGLLFGASVTLTNAAREGARAGSIHVYDYSIASNTRYKNDAARCGAVVEAATDAFGMLSTSSPHFSAPLTAGACPTPTSDILVNGDVTVSYCDHVTTPDGDCPDTTDPDTACVKDTHEGCLIRVTITYRSDIIVPFIGALLDTDANGRFIQRATATMVVN